MEFKGKIWKTGNSFVITIPKDFVDNNLLQIEKEYSIEVK